MEKRTFPLLYEIQVRGHINPAWYEWCSDAQIEHLPNGNSNLLLRLSDRSALHGILNGVQNAGIEILSLNRRIDGDER